MKKYFVFLLVFLIISVFSTGCVAPQNSGSVMQNPPITSMPANDSHIITNKSGLDVPITQIIVKNLTFNTGLIILTAITPVFLDSANFCQFNYYDSYQTKGS